MTESEKKSTPRPIAIPDTSGEAAVESQNTEQAPNKAPEAAPLTPAIFKEKLLGELGQQLPLGLPGMGDRSFAFKRYMLDEEVAIAEFKNNKRTNIGYYVAQILSYMLTHVGGQDYTQMSEPVKMLALTQMYATDVLYMYYWLRIEGMGETMDWDMSCPFCDAPFVFESNFNTMKVQMLEDPLELVWDYETKHGLQLGDKLYKILRLKTPHWGVYNTDDFKGQINPAKATAAILRSTILSADGEMVGIVDQTLRKGLHKYDYAHLGKFMDSRMGGPEMKLELKCPECKKSVNEPVQWMNPDFLSLTSFRGILSMV